MDELRDAYKAGRRAFRAGLSKASAAEAGVATVGEYPRDSPDDARRAWWSRTAEARQEAELGWIDARAWHESGA